MLSYNRRRFYARNKVILREGDVTQFAFCIISGWIGYFIDTPQGDSRIACIVGPKRAFAVGEVVDGLPMPASIVALTDCELSAITHEEVLETMSFDERMRIQIIKGVSYRCRSLINSQRDFSSSLTPAEKLSNFFSSLLLSTEMEENDDWYILPLGLTHQVISKVIGCSRVTVSRLFAKYAKEGLLRKEDGVLLLSKNLFEASALD